MNLQAWVMRNCRNPAQALAELEAELGVLGGHFMGPKEGVSESAVQAAVRLEAAKKGMRLFRNNVGALKDERGVPVRFGLANDTKELNEIIKSSDLIGWKTKIISPDMVGQKIAQFLCREVKEYSWTYTGTPREVAQLRWITMVNEAGGDAAFATGAGTL
jgi:hypothetical protein